MGKALELVRDVQQKCRGLARSPAVRPSAHAKRGCLAALRIRDYKAGWQRGLAAPEELQLQELLLDVITYAVAISACMKSRMAERALHLSEETSKDPSRMDNLRSSDQCARADGWQR